MELELQLEPKFQWYDMVKVDSKVLSQWSSCTFPGQRSSGYRSRQARKERKERKEAGRVLILGSGVPGVVVFRPQDLSSREGQQCPGGPLQAALGWVSAFQPLTRDWIGWNDLRVSTCIDVTEDELQYHV